MEKIILIGADTHRTGDGATQSDYLYDKYLDTTFENSDKLYESGGTIQKSDLTDSINNGASYVNFIDHGGPTVWCQNGGNQVLLNSNDVTSLSNGLKKPLVSAMACMTSWFDNPSGCGYQNFGECIGETFTESPQNRAIAYIGSSRSSTAAVGYNSYTYGAGGLQEDLCYQLGQNNLHMGATHTEAKDHYAYSFGNWFSDTEESEGEIQSCWLELNMLGEPEVPLWTQVPKAFQVNVTITQQRINVTVKDTATGLGIQGALVCIQGSGQYMKGKTSSGGMIGFNNPMVDGSADVTVTKPNFYTYETITPFIDVVPPITECTITPGEPTGLKGWYNETPSISLASEEWSIIHYSLYGEGDDFLTYNKPIRIPNGEVTFRYYSEDSWGNKEVPRTDVIRVDSNAPVTGVEVDPEDPTGTGGWYNTITNVTLIAEEENVDTFYRILVDGEPVGGFSVYTIPLSLKLEGEILIQFYSKDEAGNMEELLVEELRIDRTPSEVSIEIDRFPTGNGNWYSEIPSVLLSSTDEQDVIYYYFDDDEHRQYTRSFEPEEGIHVLHCYSKDPAGNMAEEKTFEFKVDTTPPEVTCMISPQHPNGLSGHYVTMPEITFRSEENVSINYSWDNEVFHEYNGDIIRPPSEGMVGIAYYGVDLAGNVGETNSKILTIDLTPPVTTVLLEPEEPDGKKDWYTSLEIELNSPTKDTAGTYYYFENVTESETYSGIITGEEIPEGIHTLVYYSQDRSGNRETENTLLIKYDPKAPKPYLEVSMEKAKIGDTVTIQAGRSKDDCGGDLLYLVDFGDGDRTRWTKKTEFTHVYSDAKEYTITLRVKDEAGHEASDKDTIVIDEFSFMEKVNNYRDDKPVAFYGIITSVVVVILGLIVVIVLVRKRKQRKDEVRDLSPEENEEEKNDPGPWTASSAPNPTESEHFRYDVSKEEGIREEYTGPVSGERGGWENEEAWDFGTGENTDEYYQESGDETMMIGNTGGDVLLSLPEITHHDYEDYSITSDGIHEAVRDGYDSIKENNDRRRSRVPKGIPTDGEIDEIFDFHTLSRFSKSDRSEADARDKENGETKSPEGDDDLPGGKTAKSKNDLNKAGLDSWNL